MWIVFSKIVSKSLKNAPIGTQQKRDQIKNAPSDKCSVTVLNRQIAAVIQMFDRPFLVFLYHRLQHEIAGV